MILMIPFFSFVDYMVDNCSHLSTTQRYTHIKVSNVATQTTHAGLFLILSSAWETFIEEIFLETMRNVTKEMTNGNNPNMQLQLQTLVSQHITYKILQSKEKDAHLKVLQFKNNEWCEIEEDYKLDEYAWPETNVDKRKIISLLHFLNINKDEEAKTLANQLLFQSNKENRCCMILLEKISGKGNQIDAAKSLIEFKKNSWCHHFENYAWMLAKNNESGSMKSVNTLFEIFDREGNRIFDVLSDKKFSEFFKKLNLRNQLAHQYLIEPLITPTQKLSSLYPCDRPEPECGEKTVGTIFTENTLDDFIKLLRTVANKFVNYSGKIPEAPSENLLANLFDEKENIDNTLPVAVSEEDNE